MRTITAKRGQGSTKQIAKERIVHKNLLINELTNLLYAGTGSEYNRDFVKTINLCGTKKLFSYNQNIRFQISFKEKNVLQIKNNQSYLWNVKPWKQNCSNKELTILETDVEQWEFFWQVFGSSLIEEWIQKYVFYQPSPLFKKRWYNKKETWSLLEKELSKNWHLEQMEKIRYLSDKQLWNYLNKTEFRDFLVNKQKIFS